MRFIGHLERNDFVNVLEGNYLLVTNDEDLIDIWEQFPASGSINRLPGEGVFVLRLHRIDHRGGAAVGQYTAIADEPILATVFPGRLGERTVGIECPGADRLGGWIPADDLHAGK